MFIKRICYLIIYLFIYLHQPPATTDIEILQ